jgi:hypothetical protein
MTIFQYLADRFYSKKIGSKQYIDVTPVLAPYKAQKGKSRTTIISFFEATNLKYAMIKLKDDKLADAGTDISQYHPKTYKILLDVDSIIECETLLPLIEQTYREAYAKALSELETAIVEETANDSIDAELVTPATAPIVTPVAAPSVTPSQYEVIELDESEMFKDTNDKPVDIETRGTRTPDGILFSAVDIGKYLDMDNLTIVLRNANRAYEVNTHWINLYQYPGIIHTSRLANQRFVMREADESDTIDTSRLTHQGCVKREAKSDADNSDQPKLIWKRIYLTLNGLLKVMFSSTSANENVVQLRNWVINLVFVHQFGSSTERMDLVESLTPYRKCLNKLSGIYLIRIGKVKDLRESMSISKDLYQPSEFDSAHVFKFGRSDDIMPRFKEHCARTGYGKYSSTISLEWFVAIPSKLCSNAESDLSKYFDLHQFKFAFNDGSKEHTELIIVKPGVDKKHIKDKYFDLVKNFPSGANAIIQQMTELKQAHDQTIDRMNLTHQLELAAERSDKKDLAHQVEILTERSESDKKRSAAEHQVELLTERSAKKDLAHQVEILQLKLELAHK